MQTTILEPVANNNELQVCTLEHNVIQKSNSFQHCTAGRTFCNKTVWPAVVIQRKDCKHPTPQSWVQVTHWGWDYDGDTW